MGQRIAPGQKQKLRFIQSWTFEAGSSTSRSSSRAARKPGPTLCVTLGIHGDELNSSRSRGVLRAVDAKSSPGR